MGFLDRLTKFTEGLTRTREAIVGKVRQIAASRGTIDEAVLLDLEEVLLAADIGPATTAEILDQLRRRVKAERYETTDELLRLLKEEIARIVESGPQEGRPIHELPDGVRPFVIMVVGVNGAGTTTTIGKLAYQYRQAGFRVVIGAADTFRAAANEQLEIWAKRAGVDIVQQTQGSDPASVAFDALSAAMARKADVVIIDTAGRLHTKTNLMDELRKIRRVLEKRLPGAPHEVLLVLDGTTGQNGLQQVRHFTDAVQVTGLVLTKLDGTAKGGIVVASSREVRVPVRFIGVGESIDDLQPFDRKAFVDALFGGSAYAPDPASGSGKG